MRKFKVGDDVMIAYLGDGNITTSIPGKVVWYTKKQFGKYGYIVEVNHWIVDHLLAYRLGAFEDELITHNTARCA